MRELLLVPLVALAGGLTAYACASDPYLKSTVACVEGASSRAAADACRAKLQDGGPDAHASHSAANDGGTHGG